MQYIMTAFQQIGIIGAGRVARALALGLAPHSEASPMLWARTPVDGVFTHRLDDITRQCDVIAIAVSDDAVASVAADLAAVLGEGRTPFVFHVSGRSGAAILEPLRAAGARTAAIHPAMTFTGDPQTEVRRMAQARFAVTGSSPQASTDARRIVERLGGTVVEIAEERRPLYHAALCHASNHLVTLMAGASRTLKAAGADDPAALLAPLVRAALENSLERGFAALSGPLLRGDDSTVEGHLDALSADCPDLLPTYRAMALATLDMLERTEPSDLRRKLS